MTLRVDGIAYFIFKPIDGIRLTGNGVPYRRQIPVLHNKDEYDIIKKIFVSVNFYEAVLYIK